MDSYFPGYTHGAEEESINYGRDRTGQHLTIDTNEMPDQALLKLADKLTDRAQARKQLRARAFKETLAEIHRDEPTPRPFDPKWPELLGQPLYDALMGIPSNVLLGEDDIAF